MHAIVPQVEILAVGIDQSIFIEIKEFGKNDITVFYVLAGSL